PYAAALEMISERVRDTSLAVFLRDGSSGERVLRSALSHFDRILAQQEFQSLLQQEMIRLHKGEPGVLPVLIKRVFEPVMIMFQSMVREGIASGELIDADWMQMQLSAIGANVMYFMSAPIRRIVEGEEGVNARNRVFMILGLLIVGSLIWYLVTARSSGDLHLISTVDANEVEVSSRIPGRIQTLKVEEGQDVKAGDLIAVIESEDL